jgi:hypothetical protein
MFVLSDELMDLEGLDSGDEGLGSDDEGNAACKSVLEWNEAGNLVLQVSTSASHMFNTNAHPSLPPFMRARAQR